MEQIKLYSTGCPRCTVLEQKLTAKNIDYEIISDKELMLSKGFQNVPMLEVDDEVMDFGKAVQWVNRR